MLDSEKHITSTFAKVGKASPHSAVLDLTKSKSRSMPLNGLAPMNFASETKSKPTILYRGQKADGRYLVDFDGKLKLAIAKLGEITGAGKDIKIRRIGASQGYVPGTHGETSVEAIGAKTKRRYKIRGYFEDVLPKVIVPIVSMSLKKLIENQTNETVVVLPEAPVELIREVSSLPKAETIAPLVDTLGESQVVNVLDAKKLIREQRQLAAFKREVSFIEAERFAKRDPLVSLTTFCQMIRRSRASIYRDIHDGKLPAPKKNGHRSFMKYSLIEMYLPD